MVLRSPANSPPPLPGGEQLPPSPPELIVAAFPSCIDIAGLYSEEVAVIARLSFEERWARAAEMADLVEALAELRDAR